MKRKLTKLIGAFMALAVFLSNSAWINAAENNLWAERNKSADSSKKQYELAALPGNFAKTPSAIMDALPAVIPTAPAIPEQIKRQVPRGTESRYSEILQSLPAAQGSIRQLNGLSSHSPKTVIYIQDVHMNVEAQQNIAQALESVIDHKTADLVALEGAFTPVDLSFFQTYPNRNAVKAVADYFFNDKRISGPVYTAMTHSVVPPVVGIDDLDHYQANVNAYRNSAPLIQLKKDQLAHALQLCEAQKRKVFNHALLDFDHHVNLSRSDHMSWGHYVRYLAARVETPSNDVAVFLAALADEEKLDFKKIETERTSIVSHLVDKLTSTEQKMLLSDSMAYRMGALSQADFYEHLKRLCRSHQIDLAQYKAMDAYIRYVLLTENVNVEKVIAAVSNMESASYAALIKTSQERQFERQSQWLYLAGKLLDFSLSSDEWKEYVALDPTNPDLKASLNSFEQFYEQAIARDDAMATNLMNAMDQAHAKVAVLVTGGFHTTGITRALKQKNIATVVYAPKLTQVDSDSSQYLSVFTQDKTPLDRLFMGEKIFTAPMVTPGQSAEVMKAMVPPVANANPAQLPERVKTANGRLSFVVTAPDQIEQDSLVFDTSLSQRISNALKNLWTAVKTLIGPKRQTRAQRSRRTSIGVEQLGSRDLPAVSGPMSQVAALHAHVRVEPHHVAPSLPISQELKGLLEKAGFQPQIKNRHASISLEGLRVGITSAKVPGGYRITLQSSAQSETFVWSLSGVRRNKQSLNNSFMVALKQSRLNSPVNLPTTPAPSHPTSASVNPLNFEASNNPASRQDLFTLKRNGATIIITDKSQDHSSSPFLEWTYSFNVNNQTLIVTDVDRNEIELNVTDPDYVTQIQAALAWAESIAQDSSAEVASAVNTAIKTLHDNYVAALSNNFTALKGSQGGIIQLKRANEALSIELSGYQTAFHPDLTYSFDALDGRISVQDTINHTTQQFAVGQEGYAEQLRIMVSLVQTVQAHHQYSSDYEKPVQHFIDTLNGQGGIDPLHFTTGQSSHGGILNIERSGRDGQIIVITNKGSDASGQLMLEQEFTIDLRAQTLKVRDADGNAQTLTITDPAYVTQMKSALGLAQTILAQGGNTTFPAVAASVQEITKAYQEGLSVHLTALKGAQGGIIQLNRENNVLTLTMRGYDYGEGPDKIYRLDFANHTLSITSKDGTVQQIEAGQSEYSDALMSMIGSAGDVHLYQFQSDMLVAVQKNIDALQLELKRYFRAFKASFGSIIELERANHLLTVSLKDVQQSAVTLTKQYVIDLNAETIDIIIPGGSTTRFSSGQPEYAQTLKDVIVLAGTVQAQQGVELLNKPIAQFIVDLQNALNRIDRGAFMIIPSLTVLTLMGLFYLGRYLKPRIEKWLQNRRLRNKDSILYAARQSADTVASSLDIIDEVLRLTKPASLHVADPFKSFAAAQANPYSRAAQLIKDEMAATNSNKEVSAEQWTSAFWSFLLKSRQLSATSVQSTGVVGYALDESMDFNESVKEVTALFNNPATRQVEIVGSEEKASQLLSALSASIKSKVAVAATVDPVRRDDGSEDLNVIARALIAKSVRGATIVFRGDYTVPELSEEVKQAGFTVIPLASYLASLMGDVVGLNMAQQLEQQLRDMIYA